ncbi:peroxide stress protein YaaA [Flavobacterium sp. SUN046]|uniref:peroxide stress protein YaaA n=1 Tax=Flavobacterium sp. SUN046 TaxID=3002440 RepID=UPI002DB8142F|nr:peroxide stress protein YaaA [Flavobacterium sp. SUN046]MEC4050494.1 peroxide stress protein YaaA [Flavobacterium sp. SUN046]
MKIVISPAKSLNFEKALPSALYTEPSFLKEATTIQRTLKKKKPKVLMELMSISDNLAQLNWQRNQDWNPPFTPQNARPAVFAFDGDVYTGLDAYSLSEAQLEVLQERLRILSGLYGLLKPLDLMQAYRLEMGTSMAVGKNKNLYEFWKKTITKTLNSELQKGELFVNLASNEYFSAVDVKTLKVPVITPEFKDYKDGKLKMISFFAKKARGMMVRYIIDTNAQTIEDLKSFDYEGYGFDANLSTETKLVFTR